MYLYINVVGVIRKRISLAVCVGWGRWLGMKIFAFEAGGVWARLVAVV